MATALSSRVDWRDISKRLNDPKQRRGIVTKTDTEELNRLRTKNAYVNRKRKILDQILRLTNFYSPRPIYVPTRPENAGRSAGPPPTHHGVGPSFPGTAQGPSTAGPGPGAAAAAAAAEDSDSEEVDMGDYEKRIRPSSAFWRRPDGMSLAEKIIYYRNWKYLNVPRQRPANQALDGDMEATLAEYRLGMTSTRRSATALASSTPRNRHHPPSATDDNDSPRSRRPISVIPRITRERHDAVMFPLIDTLRHSSRSARDLRSDDDRLPPIEENQLMSRKTAETEIDGEEDGKNKNKNRKKKKREDGRAPRDPRPNTEPDKLIRKLDRKMERDLKGLQGQDNNDDDDDDDDDSDVDEETMNDLLFGEKSKEFDRFLRS